MKCFGAKQRVPDYVRDRIHNNNGRSLGSYHSDRFYSQQRRPHNYLLPKKIKSKFNFNPHKKHQQHQPRYHNPPSNPSKLNPETSFSSSCYVCNKSFVSSQFLYSHMMRFHPEKGMKGVLPPQQAPIVKSVTLSQSQPSNEIRGLKRVWPPQQVHDRRSVIPSQSHSSNDRGVKGVLQPTRTAISPTKSVVPSRSGSSFASGSSDVTETNCDDPVKLCLSWGKKDRRGRTNNSSTCACTSNVAIASLQNRNETMDATESSSSIPSPKNTLVANQRDPSKSSRTDSEISLSDNKMMKITMSTKKYKCNTCNKDFDTDQALGGHMSSSACRAVRETKLLAAAAEHHAPTQAVVYTMKKAIDIDHVVVATMKKTMDDDIEEGEIIEDGEITDEEGSQRISRQMFDFDLNELPPEE